MRGRPVAPVSSATSTPVARIGPNALIQTLVAMQAMLPDSAVRATLAAAGELPLLHARPDSMVEERRFVALVAALREHAPAAAAAVLDRSGALTGEYVIAHRIPRFARLGLPHLPRAIALRVLLNAIRSHAWTFAGAGRFDWATHPDGATLSLADGPTARGLRQADPACNYYRACFETLLTRLIDADLTVTETACCAQGAAACRFDVRTPAARVQRSSYTR